MPSSARRATTRTYVHLSVLPLPTQTAPSLVRVLVPLLSTKPNFGETCIFCSLNPSSPGPSSPEAPKEALQRLLQAAGLLSPAPSLNPSPSLIVSGHTLQGERTRVLLRARETSVVLLTRGVTPNDLPPVFTFHLRLPPRPAPSHDTSRHGRSFNQADGF